MTVRARQLLAVFATLAAALPARADGPSGPASAGAGPAEPATPRVRASHRVEVIAPGERVETVLDRMRSLRGAPPGVAAERHALPVRAPEAARERARRPEASGGTATASGQVGAGTGAASPVAEDGERLEGIPHSDGAGAAPVGGDGERSEGNPHSDGPRSRH